MIRYLEQGEIDRKKWDACILNSWQKLIYPFTWYLDLVCENWSGLVEDDYVSVMPLPWKEKIGVKYIYQPLYTQQLGIYSSTALTREKFLDFYKEIPSKYRYIDVSMNYLHEVRGLDLNIRKRDNYELRLNHPYQDIFEKFSANTQRNINKTLASIEIKENIPVHDLVKLKRENSVLKFDARFYEWQNCLISGLIQRKRGFTIGAISEGRLVGAAFFAMCSGRIYYLIPVSSKEGKSKRAMFAILDYVIGKYADTGLVLDFEGSSIRGIARFFAGFGAKVLNYYSLKENRLPFYLKFLKK